MARRIVRDEDRALRDEYRLSGWVSKVEERRKQYFSWCDRALEQLSEIAEGEPSDTAVVMCLMGALYDDDSFSGFVLKRGGAFLTEKENWPKIYHAGAATIYHEYLVAVEKREWPLSDA